MKKTILLLVALIGLTVCNAKTKVEPVTIKGVVYETVNGQKQPLTLANIHCEGTTLGTTSVKGGNYDMNLSAGKYKVVFSFAGYKPVTKEITVKKSTKAEALFVDIELAPEEKLASM